MVHAGYLGGLSRFLPWLDFKKAEPMVFGPQWLPPCCVGVGGFLALLMTVLFQGSPAAVLNSVLSGMALRTGIPLVGGFVLQSQVEPLAAAGIMGYVLVYYLYTLVVETILSLKLIPAGQKQVGVASSSTPNSSI